MNRRRHSTFRIYKPLEWRDYYRGESEPRVKYAVVSRAIRVPQHFDAMEHIVRSELQALAGAMCGEFAPFLCKIILPLPT